MSTKLLPYRAEPHYDSTKIGAEKLHLHEELNQALEQYKEALWKVGKLEASIEHLNACPSSYFRTQQFFR